MAGARGTGAARHWYRHRLGCPTMSARVSYRSFLPSRRRSYHIKSRQGVELDETMEVTKTNGYWQEHDIARVAAKKPNEFHHLGEAKHEEKLCPKSVLPVCRRPPGGGPPTSNEQQRVE